MSIYDNDTKKTHVALNPIEPQEPQTYSLKKLTEIEAIFLDEIEVRKQIAKRIKQFNTTRGIVDAGPITSTVITGGFSIAAFASGVGLPVGIALSGASPLFSLATAITPKFFNTFAVKQEKTPCY